MCVLLCAHPLEHRRGSRTGTCVLAAVCHLPAVLRWRKGQSLCLLSPFTLCRAALDCVCPLWAPAWDSC